MLYASVDPVAFDYQEKTGPKTIILPLFGQNLHEKHVFRGCLRCPPPPPSLTTALLARVAMANVMARNFDFGFKFPLLKFIL